MVDKIINNIKLPNGEVYAIGGGSRFGLKGDYSTHYGIEYCQHGLIDNPVGTTDIIVKGGMMLCLPGADTKTTIGSDITYSITSLTDVTIFYADGNILEAGEVYYALTEPADNGIENYMAWWNPDFGKWQFKSNDTGNVWREAIATPIADIRIEEGNIVRIDYIGYRVLNDDIYGLKSETADIDLSNLTQDGEKHFLNKTQISNCLLEVPQRIKLELNDGVLTLKAGSQVIVPNGFEEDGVTPRFDYVDIESDITKKVKPEKDTVFTLTYGKNLAWALDNVERFDFFTNGESMYSGSTAPTTTQLNNIWYDTSTNKMKSSNDTGKTWVESDVAFPICKFKVTNLVVSSIDQVFNGMGYIGSTVWVDKGVKGLIPNGRNEDGTLRNEEFTTESVLMFTKNITLKDRDIILKQNEVNETIALSWDEENNVMKAQGGATAFWVTVGKVSSDSSGKITNLQPKQPFRAVDYSDKAEVSGWSFPSSKYIDLTLGASGSTYTAPANGWAVLSAKLTVGKHITIFNVNTQVGTTASFYSNSGSILGVINTPCKKGETFQVVHNTPTENIVFRFVYAQGEV